MNIYIDADVIISSQRRKESNHSESKKFVKHILDNSEDSEFFFYTSSYTLLEVASGITRRTKDIRKAKALLYDLAVTWEDKISIINPIEKHKTHKRYYDKLIETTFLTKSKAGDTIQSMIALDNDIDVFITWNTTDFKYLAKKKIQLFTPAQFLNEKF